MLRLRYVRHTGIQFEALPADEEAGMSAEPARLLLGELLVHKGVLTEAQLDVALEEQRQCGKPLGEILVRLGFSTGPEQTKSWRRRRFGKRPRALLTTSHSGNIALKALTSPFPSFA